MQQQVPWLAAERYEVGEVVGRGGYGMVCRGVDRKTGHQVALKMLSPEAGRDPDVVERMLREQQALVALSGTCAVTAIDLCRLDSGAPCLVMEWLDGSDLEQQLTAWEAAGQRGSTVQLLAILKPLTQTLERAHQIGIVHRDIKPANIFLTTEGSRGVRLLDFGLSRMKSAAPLTAFGMVMGSPSYIAPETWRGDSALLDGRADLFALAVIVFRWLTGKLPFEASDLIGKMTAVTGGPRPSALALRPELPPAVDVWMSRALAVEPADRFQTGADFYDALGAALRGEMWAASADVSGVRQVAKVTPGTETPERKNALATAWRAAASLLRRFTGSRDRETPEVTPPPAPAPKPLSEPREEPSATDRKTLWLDSEHLEEVPESEHQPAPEPAKAVTPPPAKPKRQPQPKPQPKAKKPKANAKPKNAKRPKKIKPTQKRKPSSRKRNA